MDYLRLIKGFVFLMEHTKEVRQRRELAALRTRSEGDCK